MTNELSVRRSVDFPIVDYGYRFGPSYTVLPPETEMAKQTPSLAFKLLDRISQRELYSDCTRVAGGIVNTYLNCSSQDNVNSIAGVDIDMKHHISFFGNDRGFSMRIRIDKRVRS